MVGWHHHLDRHEFEQTEGGSDGQGSLAEPHCCSGRLQNHILQSMGLQRVGQT